MKKIVYLGICVMALLFGMVLGFRSEAMAATKTVYVTKGESHTIKIKKATKTIKWNVSKKSIVKAKGGKGKLVLKGRKKGTTKIRGKVNGKEYKYKVMVETPQISKKSISLKMTDTDVVKITGTKRKVNWSVDDISVVSIASSSGKITPIAIGSTYVYAKIGKKKYKCRVTVEDTIVMKEVKIANGSNKIYGKMYRPEADGTYPVIIMCHGFNGIADDFTNESKYYARNGYIAYAFDFCGGSTRTRSTGLKTTDMTIFTEKSDLLAVYDYFEKMGGVDKNRMFIMGGSQGGLVAALAAEDLKDRARAMALYFPALSIPDNWRRTYPDVNKIPETVNLMGMNLGKNFFVSMHEFSAFNEIGGFEKPVYILHGNKDNMVPLNDSQRAVKIYKNAKLKIMEGEGHGFRPAAGKIAMEEVLKFMEENK